MRFIIDMNLSPQWVGFLRDHGYDAIHWADVGRHDADDGEILDWARLNDWIVLTSDLDFGVMLITSNLEKPSVVQLRTGITLPLHVGSLALSAIEQQGKALESGALLTVEPGRFRVRPLSQAMEP
jgi:predicted nuclease of predicted toxin-antitoxin system